MDEIATVPLRMQQKLLKAKEEKTFYPVGGSKPVKSEFRLISATCEDIYEKIQENNFRLDLFHRINGLLFTIPPLRERKEDITLVIEHFLKQAPRKIYIEENAMETLVNYTWVGNVREVKTLVENLADNARGLVKLKDLPSHIRKNQNPLAEGTKNLHFLPEEHVNFLRSHGIGEYLNKVGKEALKVAMELGEKTPNKIIEILQVNTSRYYRLLKKDEEEKVF